MERRQNRPGAANRPRADCERKDDKLVVKTLDSLSRDLGSVAGSATHSSHNLNQVTPSQGFFKSDFRRLKFGMFHLAHLKEA